MQKDVNYVRNAIDILKSPNAQNDTGNVFGMKTCSNMFL